MADQDEGGQGSVVVDHGNIFRYKTRMFQKAFRELANHHAFLPIEIAIRLVNGEVRHGIGAGILVNDEGWILTAGHIMNAIHENYVAEKKAKARHQKVEEIKSNTNLSREERQAMLDGLGELKPSDISDAAVGVAAQGIVKYEGTVYTWADIGVMRARNFVIPKGYSPPCFRKQSAEIGEMICRVGYPFYKREVNWDEERGCFVSTGEIVPPFVNEGIVSRFVRQEVSFRSGQKEYVEFMETSSPGLRGQSGGPLFDQEGKILGMQSQTHSYALDLAPENQFLNVGWALRTVMLIRMMDKLKISYLAD